MSRQPVIGITDCEKYANYERWILADGNAKAIRLASNLEDVAHCDGIVLTGGEDIHPGRYGKDIHYANAPDEYEEARDAFETEVFKLARHLDMPVLGICRGLQLINCVQGGNLKQDLGTLNDTHKRISKDDKVHAVEIKPSSLLRRISGKSGGQVNSSHHQAIEKLGKDMDVNCYAPDGTIEGIESVDEPFLLAVQWHPERMLDQASPFAKNIKEAFLQKARNFRP